MKIMMLPPFDKMANRKEIKFCIKEKITVKELLNILCQKYPKIKLFLEDIELEQALQLRIVFIRDGVVLKPKDVLSDNDSIYIIIPLMGG